MSRVEPPRELNLKFKVLKFLGKGSYGSVYQVQRLSDGKVYALKEMDVKSMSQPEREDSVNEIRLLASIQHHNVIRYHEAFLDGHRLCIIMEYCPGGDLARTIKQYQATKKPMPEDAIWKHLIQVVQGLTALHALKILHRDIKPGNIMVQANDVVKIGDLGIAKVLKSTMAKTQIGTPHYMPPEIWKNRPYSFSSDAWALGCALYEMMTYNVPFEARSMQELRFKVLKGTYPPLPGHYSRDLQQIVKECLDPNPDRRPTMDALLAYPSMQQRMGLLPEELSQAVPSTAQSSMLATIVVPKDIKQMKNIRLPGPQYEEQGMMDMIAEEDSEYMRKQAALAARPRVNLSVAAAGGIARPELNPRVAANLPPAARAAMAAAPLPALPSRPVPSVLVPAKPAKAAVPSRPVTPKSAVPSRPASAGRVYVAPSAAPQSKAAAGLQHKVVAQPRPSSAPRIVAVRPGSAAHRNASVDRSVAPTAQGAVAAHANPGVAVEAAAGPQDVLSRMRQWQNLHGRGNTSANAYGAFYNHAALQAALPAPRAPAYARR